MTHEERRAIINAELKRNALSGLTATEEDRIISGLSSGSLMLNTALSGSPFVGYVWGRMVEIFGPESSGKTTLALEAVRQAQMLETVTGESIPVLYIDAEHALDPVYAESLGINLDNFSLSQPDCGEDALDVTEVAVRNGYRLIVVDSVAALTPRAEIEGAMGEAHMGLQARLMSQACRKLSGIINKTDSIIIWINQIRSKIGLVFGNPETTTGGNALKFYTTYRLEVRAPRKGAKKGKTLMGYGDKDVEIGTDTNIKVVKNKVFPPYRQASVTIMYGKGIDKVKDTVAYLEYVGAFKGDGGLMIPSKKKAYTARGLAGVLHEPDVQKDVLTWVRDNEAVSYDSYS